MSERVLEVVLGRIPRWVCGEVSGFASAPLGDGRCYPGAFRKPGSVLRGRVLCDLTRSELDRLDRFEGDEYEASSVPNVTLQGGASVSARMWILPPSEMGGVLDGDWSFDAFLAKDEEWYVKMCQEWADEDSVEHQKCTPQQRGAH